ncbi:MAG: DUF805 domain-containing protein [Burkholderiaceae bacterium]
MNSYMQFWQRALDFSGRTRRRDYWLAMLVHIVIMMLLAYIGGGIDESGEYSPGILGSLYVLASLVPAIAIGIRRFHDTGRSGWWMLIGFIPFIGGLIVLIFMLIAGQPDENQYGPSPK